MVLVFYCCGVPYRKQLSPVKWCGDSANAQASGGGHKPQDDGLVGADPVSAPTNPFRAKQGLAPLLAFGSAGEPYAKRRSPPTRPLPPPKHPCHPEPMRLIPLGPSCRGIPIDAQHRYGVTGRGHAPQGPLFRSALERPALRRRQILRPSRRREAERALDKLRMTGPIGAQRPPRPMPARSRRSSRPRPPPRSATPAARPPTSRAAPSRQTPRSTAPMRRGSPPGCRRSQARH